MNIKYKKRILIFPIIVVLLVSLSCNTITTSTNTRTTQKSTNVRPTAIISEKPTVHPTTFSDPSLAVVTSIPEAIPTMKKPSGKLMVWIDEISWMDPISGELSPVKFENLPEDGGGISNLSLSYNGEHMAILYRKGGDDNSYVILFADWNGQSFVVNEEIKIPDTASADPSISPDGSKVAFIGVMDSRGRYDVIVSDRSGNQSLLFPDANASYQPDFSRNGSFLTFSPDFKLDSVIDGEIHIIESNGNGVRKLYNNEDHHTDTRVSWSPDDSEVATLCLQPPYNSDSERKICIFNVSGNTNRTVDFSGLWCGWSSRDTTWSPNGDKLAAVCADKIVTVNQDGSDTKVLFENSQGKSFVQIINWIP